MTEHDEVAAIKAELLAKYAQRQALLFHQFDGFLDSADDFSDQGDGDSIFSRSTYELRKGIDVRIQILDGTTKEDAVRILRKMVDWIDRDGLHHMETGQPAPELFRPVKTSEDDLPF
jgi:hypothetical protein